MARYIPTWSSQKLTQRNENHKAPKNSLATSTPTSEAMLEAVIVLAGLVLLVLVLYWQRRDPWPQRRKEPPVILAYCAWCIHRDGEDCSQPGSPVCGQPCSSVYIETALPRLVLPAGATGRLAMRLGSGIRIMALSPGC